MSWEAGAVFNPAIIKDGELYRMLYRTYPSNLAFGESRGYRPGNYLKNQISHIGYAESIDGVDFTQNNQPFISPDTNFDAFGCEDPRITKIGDTFYITYTAIDGSLDDRENPPHIRIALATTKDFKSIEKHGIIGPNKNSKAGAFFSVEETRKYAFALTIDPDTQNSYVAIRYFDSIKDIFNNNTANWDSFMQSEENILFKTEPWLERGPELGAPPIQTDAGWLWIYSSESMSNSWTVSAALSEIANPHKIISRTTGNILEPATEYEMNGIVPNVTFPSGALITDETLNVYYGAADTVIGLAQCNIDTLVNNLLEN
jgi:predicted GH43/DUF377 family glycosyl hydrolase